VIRRDGLDALHQNFGHHPDRYLLARQQEAPSQPIPLGRFLMQQSAALAGFSKRTKELSSAEDPT